jgi:hypothetical protein
MSTIITPVVIEMFRVWMDAFRDRWASQPPQFTNTRYSQRGWSFHDHYMGLVGDIRVPNPRNEPWFNQMILSGTAADLDALLTAFTPDPWDQAYLSFIQFELLEEAYNQDEKGVLVSKALPAWYRARGWGIPPKWTCEKKDE